MERKCTDCVKSTDFGICTLSKTDKETCLNNESRPFWKPKGIKLDCEDCSQKPTCVLEPTLCDKNNKKESKEGKENFQEITEQLLKEAETIERMHTGNYDDSFWDAAKTIERETKEAQKKENKYAPKERKNKPKPSLIPFDLLLKYLEPAYQEGLIRYYRESWRLGFPITDMYDSAMRHLEKFFFQKEDWDKDAEKLGIKKHHLGGVLFSVLCMLDTFENHPELDNRGKDWKEDK
jgi:hypothetical protein